MVTFCPLLVVTRIVSPSPTETSEADPLTSGAAAGLGVLVRGAGDGVGAM